ncbi:short-chain dehydrogenase [Nocardiopsis oceani]
MGVMNDTHADPVDALDGLRGRALVIGGTGMLSGAVRGLAGLGWELVVPSRNPWRAPPRGVRWVRSEWGDPGALTEAVRATGTTTGSAHEPAPFDLLVAWVHTPHRERVLTAVEPLLSKRAVVVEVWGSASRNPLTTLPPPVLDLPTHQAVLGYQRHNGGTRWLTDGEISEGVLAAARSALTGALPRVHEVGTLTPWPP